MNWLFHKDKKQFTLLTKIICSFLAFLMVFSTGIVSCYAMGAGVPERLELDSVLSDYIENIIDLDDVKSVDTEKTTDSELYLNMKDNSTAVYTFSEPVTYTDENGNIKCKDNIIEKQEDKNAKKAGYDYSNGQNDYRINFSSDSEKGIFVVYNDISFSIAPISDCEAEGYIADEDGSSRSFQIFAYKDIFGAGTILKYYPQINGVKEEIILDKKIGINHFQSKLTVDGCYPKINEDGSISLVSSETEEEVQHFIAPFAYDSQYTAGVADEHFCSDCKYEIEQVSDTEYILSVTVSEEWLGRDTTIYPVTIDPTTSNIYNYADAGVYSETPDKNYGSEQTCGIGYNSEFGYGRIYTRFNIPSDIKKYAVIQNAEIWESELTGDTAALSVTPYMVKSSWSETGIKWSNMPEYDSDTKLETKIIDGDSIDDPYDSNMYSFNIKAAVEKWIDGTSNNGIVFISNAEQTNRNCWKTFAAQNYISSDYRPFTVIKYVNDTRAPKLLSVTGNPTEWTNEDVILTANATDEVYSAVSGIASYSFTTSDAVFTAQTANTKTISSNGTYYVRARDNAGNTSTAIVVKIDKIDKVKPTTPVVTGLPTSRVKNDIVLTADSTDALSGIAAYSFSTESGVYDWQSENTKTISENGVYYVCSKDQAGNLSAEVSVNVNKIDKTKPSDPVITGNATEWTNEDVILTATPTDETADIVEYSFSTTAGSYVWQTEPYKAFSSNCTVYSYFKDSNGDISAADPVVINRIDKTLPATPTITAAYSTDKVVLTATSSDSQSGLSEYSFSDQEGVYNWQQANTKEFTENTYAYIYARDFAGNISAVTEKKVFIGDVTAPTFIDVTGNVTEWTKENVTLTVNGAEDTESGLHELAYSFSNSQNSYNWQAENSKAITSNQTVYIYVRDDAGNIAYVDTVTVDKIDKSAPTFTYTYEHNIEADTTTVTITATDSMSGVAAYSVNGGKTWSESNVITFEKDIYNYIDIRVKDNVGNVSAQRILNFYYPKCYKENGKIVLYSPNPKNKGPIYYRISKKIFTVWHTYSEPFTTDKDTIYISFVTPPSTLNISIEHAVTYPVSSIPTIKPNYVAGKYEETNTDASFAYKGINLDFSRTYDNVNNRWFFAVNSSVEHNSATNRLTAVFPDFSKHVFLPKTVNSYYDPYSDYIIDVTRFSDGSISSYSIKFDDIVYQYNSQGQLCSLSNRNGDKINITHSDAWIIAADEAGREYVYTLDDNKNIVSLTDPAGGVIRYTYNEKNKLVSVLDQAGVYLDTYSYDTNGRVSKNNDVTINYNSANRITSRVYDSGAYENYTYSGNIVTANTSKEETSIVKYNNFGDIYYTEDNDGNSVTLTYDGRRNISKIENSQGEVTNYYYYSNGLLSRFESNSGKALYCYYDSNGNCSYEKIVNASETSYRYYVYDSISNIILLALLKSDYKGDIPKKYDEALDCFDTVDYTYTNGMLAKCVDNKNNSTESYIYDIYGNQIKTVKTTIKNGKTVTETTNYTYNLFGAVLTSSNDTDSTTKTYDKAGRLLLENKNGKYSRTVYDNLGRKTQEISSEDYDASKDGLPTNNTYSDTSVGHTYKYAANGTLTSETNRFGDTTKYFYNSNGSMIIKEFDLYKYHYSNHGELQKITVGSTDAISYSYDDKFNPTVVSFANGYVNRYEYDYNKNVIAQYHNSETTPYVTYTYDKENQLTEKTNSDIGLRTAYKNNEIRVTKTSDDSLIQLYKKTTTEADKQKGIKASTKVNETHYGTTYSTVYTDDYVSFANNSSSDVVYSNTYDEDEILISNSIKYSDTVAISSTYSYTDDMLTKMLYSYKINDQNATIAFVNEYDNKGRITASGNNKVTDYYSYDSNNQLTRVDSNNSYTTTYSYDNRGNITSKKTYAYTRAESITSSPKSTTTFKYATSGLKDQLVSVNGTALTYDLNGNVLTYGNKKFTWSNGKNLSGIIDGNNKYNYLYDEDGLRANKTINGKTTYYNYVDGSVRYQTDGTNTMYFQYSTTSAPVGFIYNGSQYFYMINQNNDVMGITDKNGNLLCSYTYDEWGTPKVASNSANTEIAEINPIRYRGYYYDNETGYYYLQSRYYDPSICRFINSDTYDYIDNTSQLGFNLFAYCGNNPINFSDHNGHDFTWETIFKFLKVIFILDDVSITMEKIFGFNFTKGFFSFIGDIFDLLPSVGTVFVNIILGIADAAGELLKNVKNTIFSKENIISTIFSSYLGAFVGNGMGATLFETLVYNSVTVLPLQLSIMMISTFTDKVLSIGEKLTIILLDTVTSIGSNILSKITSFTVPKPYSTLVNVSLFLLPILTDFITRMTIKYK